MQCSRYPDSGDGAASKRKEFPSNYNLDAFPSNAPAISYKPGGNFSTEKLILYLQRDWEVKPRIASELPLGNLPQKCMRQTTTHLAKINKIVGKDIENNRWRTNFISFFQQTPTLPKTNFCFGLSGWGLFWINALTGLNKTNFLTNFLFVISCCQRIIFCFVPLDQNKPQKDLVWPCLLYADRANIFPFYCWTKTAKWGWSFSNFWDPPRIMCQTCRTSKLPTSQNFLIQCFFFATSWEDGLLTNL